MLKRKPRLPFVQQRKIRVSRYGVRGLFRYRYSCRRGTHGSGAFADGLVEVVIDVLTRAHSIAKAAQANAIQTGRRPSSMRAVVVQQVAVRFRGYRGSRKACHQRRRIAGRTKSNKQLELALPARCYLRQNLESRRNLLLLMQHWLWVWIQTTEFFQRQSSDACLRFSFLKITCVECACSMSACPN